MSFEDSFSYRDLKEACPQKILRDLLAKEILTEEEKETKALLLAMKESYDKTDARCDSLNERAGLRSTYYDYEGKPISMWEWSELHTYHKHIADTHSNGFRISTVYLGMDLGTNHARLMGHTRPVIFETMVFAQTDRNKGSGLDDYQERYCTEEEAFMGHIRVCQLVMNYV